MTLKKTLFLSMTFALFATAASLKASYYQIEQDTKDGKGTYNVTCYGTANTEFRDFLAKPNIKEVISIFSPTLRIEDTGGTLRVFASHGSSHCVKNFLGFPRSFQISTTSLKATVGALRLNDKITLDALLGDSFSAPFYLAHNPDLASFMPEIQDRNRAGIMHYMNFGYLEDRVHDFEDVDPAFDPQSYLDCNPDVAAVAQRQSRPLSFAIDHHFVLAADENRPYIPQTFDVTFYLKMNPDVAEPSKASPNPDEYVRTHYLNYGRLETGRICIVPLEGFDAGRYYEQNLDIKDALFRDVPHKEDKETGTATFKTDAYNNYAISHFRTFGYFEGRPH